MAKTKRKKTAADLCILCDPRCASLEKLFFVMLFDRYILLNKKPLYKSVTTVLYEVRLLVGESESEAPPTKAEREFEATTDFALRHLTLKGVIRKVSKRKFSSRFFKSNTSRKFQTNPEETLGSLQCTVRSTQ